MGVERDDGSGAAWEVEVQRPDGGTVEVTLSAGLEQVGTESDDDSGGDGDSGEGDDD